MREAFTLMQGPMHRIDRRLGPRLRPTPSYIFPFCTVHAGL